MRVLTMLAAIASIGAADVFADYRPYQYQPTGKNQVSVENESSHPCACVRCVRSGRIEYAPYRLVVTGQMSHWPMQPPVPRIVPFIDLQPRYRYER